MSVEHTLRLDEDGNLWLWPPIIVGINKPEFFLGLSGAQDEPDRVVSPQGGSSGTPDDGAR